MFISKKELKKLEQFQQIMEQADSIEQINFFRVHKDIKSIVEKANKRREKTKNIFAGAFITLFFAIMIFYSLNGYSFII